MVFIAKNYCASNSYYSKVMQARAGKDTSNIIFNDNLEFISGKDIDNRPLSLPPGMILYYFLLCANTSLYWLYFLLGLLNTEGQ